MQQPQEPVLANPAVNDELLLDDDELKTLAKFLDVLMEVDFERNSIKGLVANVS